MYTLHVWSTQLYSNELHIKKKIKTFNAEKTRSHYWNSKFKIQYYY